MVELRDVVHRLRLGHSVKAIHRQTGRHKTVIRALRDLAAREGWMDLASELPSEGEVLRRYQQILTAGREQPHILESYETQIKEWLAAKYSFQVIHRLLTASGVAVSETTVRRWVHRRHPQSVLPVIVRTTVAGQVMEVDFGYLGVFWDPESGRQRKVWFFSARLRHSRRVYRQVVFEQSQQTFFRCHINAFEFFGGVTATVTPDNLKAAIVRASYESPLVNRAYRSLAEHYRFLICPCPPGCPELKGGVESDVRYVKRNFLPLFTERQKQRGQSPARVDELASELERWNVEVCDTHIVQKVGQSPLEIFEQEEVAALRPLPPSRWDPVIYKEASVGRDWRVQFQRAFYSVPYRLIGSRVLVMANSSTVRVYQDGEEVTMHARATHEWQYVWKAEHGPPQLEQFLTMSSQGLLTWASRVGPSVSQLVSAILADKAVDGLRPARALMRLGERYGRTRLLAACSRALRYHLSDYQSVKNILIGNLDRLPEDQPADAPSGQRQFRFQREEGYFDSPAEEEVRYG